MRLKKLATIVMAGIISTSLVACSSSSGGKNTSEGNEKVTVGIWNGNEAEQKAFDTMVKNFEEKTNIKVDKKIYTDYNTQLKTDLIGGTAPDVFYLDVNLSPEMMDSGVLEPLNQYIDEEYDVKDIYPNLVDGFKDKSQETYAMPKDYSSLSVYYNENLLKEAGYTKDDIPKEFEKWPEFLKELQSKLPEGKKAAMIDPNLDRLMSLIEANDVEIVNDKGLSNVNDPKVMEVLSIVESLYKNGSTKQASELGYGWNGDAFGAEAGAIMIEGNWVVGHLRENFSNVKYGTLEMPTYKGKNSSMLFTVGYAINKDSKNKDNAWEFVKYATGKEGMKTNTSISGALPARESVSKDTKVNEDSILVPHIKSASYGTVWQKGTTLPIVDREFKNWMPAVISGNENLENAMKKASDTANKDIEAQMK